MAIIDSDIIVYGAANMPEDDTSLTGGAIDRTIKILNQDMSDVGGTDTLDIVSDSAGDTTQTVTITGRDASGVIQTDALSLNGVALVNGAQAFERILKIVVSATYVGTITVSDTSGSVTLVTLEGSGANPGGSAVLENRRPFYAAEAEASGGSAVTLYEKVFVANTHASLALLTAAIELTDDGSADNTEFDLEDATNDTNSVAARTTEPSGMQGAPTWDAALKNVPGTDLGDRTTGTSDHIGVWIRLSLAAGQAPNNTKITFNVTGSST